MSGFANSIIGGMSALIRAAIRSPNYVTGVSGWTINKDGTAEFNSLTIRGTVAMTPIAQGTLGNLYWQDGFVHPAQIYEDSGLSALILRPPTTNNTYTKLIMWNDGAFNGRVWLYAWRDSGAGAGVRTATVTLGEHGLEIIPTDNIGGLPVITIGRASGVDTTKIRMSSVSQEGAFYFEKINANGLTVHNNTLTTLAPVTVALSETDYPSAWNLATGVWTCPETGHYIVTIDIFYTVTITGRFLVLWHDNTFAVTSHQLDLPGPGILETLTFIDELQQGDQYIAQILHVDGAGIDRFTAAGTSVAIRRLF